MAGYFLYTIDNDVFTQLTTAPTRQQGDTMAELILENWDEYLEDYLDNFDEDPETLMWPTDPDAMSALICERLAQSDWYSDLSCEDADMWDNFVFALQDEPGEEIGIDFQCSDYESIYWDCAEIAAAQGATMIAAPTFGHGGFRYFGKPSEYEPIYTLFTPPRVNELLAQLERVKPHFASLPDREGSDREQFFEGLLPPVQHAAKTGRILWVQTDT